MKATWVQSEPPRGSGWVHAQHLSIGAYGVPTRYCVVVLTVRYFLRRWEHCFVGKTETAWTVT